MAHFCHWPGCDVAVSPAKFACRGHWYALPQDIRDAISGAYRAGQEITKTPSAAYIAAARRALEWIAAQPPKPIKPPAPPIPQTPDLFSARPFPKIKRKRNVQR